MDYPLSKEKLSPVLACIKVKDAKEGIQRCVDMTEFGGIRTFQLLYIQTTMI